MLIGLSRVCVDICGLIGEPCDNPGAVSLAEMSGGCKGQYLPMFAGSAYKSDGS